MLTIEGKQFGRKASAITTTHPSPDGEHTTLRTLITHIVASEIDAFNQRQLCD